MGRVSTTKFDRVAAVTVKPTQEPSPTAHAMSNDVEPLENANVEDGGGGDVAGRRNGENAGTNALIGEVTKS